MTDFPTYMHTFWCNDIRLSVIQCKEFLQFLIIAAWGLSCQLPMMLTRLQWCCYITQLYHIISFNSNWKPVGNCFGELMRLVEQEHELSHFISHLVQEWLSNCAVPEVMLSQRWTGQHPHLCTEMLRPHSLLSMPNWINLVLWGGDETLVARRCRRRPDGLYWCLSWMEVEAILKCHGSVLLLVQPWVL